MCAVGTKMRCSVGWVGSRLRPVVLQVGSGVRAGVAVPSVGLTRVLSYLLKTTDGIAGCGDGVDAQPVPVKFLNLPQEAALARTLMAVYELYDATPALPRQRRLRHI